MGNKTFSGGVIRDALHHRMEFHLAAHPAAPLADYASKVEKMIRDAYLRQGFPNVQVKSSVNAKRGQVRVKIDEGQRFKTGEIRFVGPKGSRDPVLQTRLREALSGSAGPPTNTVKGLWRKDVYAPFDEGATAEMRDRVLEQLAELNYYKPTLKLTVVPMRDSGRGDLVIEMADEGLKGTIDDIGIFYPADEKKNTDSEMEKYLGLKPGMPLRANLVTEITNRLWLSGRFLKQQATIVPLPDEGHFKLELDLEDLDEAPPLRQALSTNESVVLKLCQWLNDFTNHPEDLIISVRVDYPQQSLIDADIVLSKQGLLWVARKKELNREPRLAYAMILSSNGISCCAGWREHRLTIPTTGTVSAFVSVLPKAQPKAAERYELMIGAGLSSEESVRPIDIILRLAPVEFLELARQDKTRYQSDGTSVAATFPTSENCGPVTVRVEKATGRLIGSHFQWSTNDLRVSLEARSEQGAYKKVISEVSKMSDGQPNDYDPARPASSLLGLVLSDVLESGLLESAAVSNYIALAASPKQASDFVIDCREIRVALARLKSVLGQQDLAGCLRPFDDTINRFFKSEGAAFESDDFYIPLQPELAQNSMAFFIGTLAAFMIDKSDALWPRNSWPWTLARETAFTIAGQNPYTGGELARLFESEKTGPLGCWAAAVLLARVNAPLAERFARRSLEHLSLAQLESDLAILFAPENAMGQILCQTFSQLSQFKQSDVESLSSLFGTNMTHLTQEIAAAARSKTNQAPVEVLRPALAEAWAPLLQPQMDGALRAWLRKVGTPDTPEAAFDRANFILEAADKPEEFAEAARVLEFAANKGLARAQLRLGRLYQTGKGVPLDYPQALNWFLKAADQGELHAACCIGDIYFEGQGVIVDKATAMIWYERDARRGCIRAQFQVGQCAEQQSKPVEAFAWYRLAATNGCVEAQTTLAERLSDELQPAPNFAEAYLWYRIAADAGNRVAGVSARRMKTKLTSAQAEQVDKEARKISKRIESLTP